MKAEAEGEDMVFRLLIGRHALSRVSDRFGNEGIAIDPVILEDDGTLIWNGQPTTIDVALPTIAWHSPELYALGLYGSFLKLVEHCSSIRWMQSGRAGYDEPQFAALARNGVRITMSKGPAIAMAEYTMATILDHFQRGPERRAAQQAEQWTTLPFREVAGSKWLFIGFGAIAKEAARRARAFGAHVTGVRQSGRPDPDADRIVPPGTMATPLAEADVIVLTVPLTPETADSFGVDFFAGTRRGAVFVNIGRGQLVDEDALHSALDSGHLAHAILDVTRIEPLPAGAWQWHHPSVTLTAHTSALGSGLMDRTDDVLIENMRRYCAGSALLYEIAPDLFAQLEGERAR